jgi:hypothetical protein
MQQPRVTQTYCRCPIARFLDEVLSPQNRSTQQALSIVNDRDYSSVTCEYLGTWETNKQSRPSRLCGPNIQDEQTREPCKYGEYKCTNYDYFHFLLYTSNPPIFLHHTDVLSISMYSLLTANSLLSKMSKKGTRTNATLESILLQLGPELQVLLCQRISLISTLSFILSLVGCTSR